MKTNSKFLFAAVVVFTVSSLVAACAKKDNGFNHSGYLHKQTLQATKLLTSADLQLDSYIVGLSADAGNNTCVKTVLSFNGDVNLKNAALVAPAGKGSFNATPVSDKTDDTVAVAAPAPSPTIAPKANPVPVAAAVTPYLQTCHSATTPMVQGSFTNAVGGANYVAMCSTTDNCRYYYLILNINLLTADGTEKPATQLGIVYDTTAGVGKDVFETIEAPDQKTDPQALLKTMQSDVAAGKPETGT